jgi:Fic family protein
MIDRLLNGFVGTLTSTKWAQLTKTSPDTALRDINDLVEREILAKGLGTSYSLALPGTGDSSSR